MGNVRQPAPNGSLVLEMRKDGVVTLMLNRPDRLNALNVELGTQLVVAFSRLAADQAVRAVILTGVGRGFCAGGDLTVLADVRRRNAGHELAGLLRAGMDIVLAIADSTKPVLAAVNGPAAGGGMNLALACDIRVASEQATFGQNFAKVGLYPDFGGTWLLPRLVGPARAAELFYTGEMITASEALRIGVVNRVVPQERLVAETNSLAAQLAAAPPLAARAIKRAIFGSNRDDLIRTLEAEIEQQVKCFGSADCAEGLTAFFEKRPPRFQGR